MNPIEFKFTKFSLIPGDTIEVLIDNKNSYTFWVSVERISLNRFHSDLYGEELEEEKNIARKLVNERVKEEMRNFI
jgi:hypothetical protein